MFKQSRFDSVIWFVVAKNWAMIQIYVNLFCVAKHVRWLHCLRKHNPRARLARYIVLARNRRCFHNHMLPLDLGGILCK